MQFDFKGLRIEHEKDLVRLVKVQEDTVLNNLKVQIRESAVKLQTTYTNMKEQLFTVKENIHIKAVDIVNDV